MCLYSDKQNKHEIFMTELSAYHPTITSLGFTFLCSSYIAFANSISTATCIDKTQINKKNFMN